MTSTSLTPTHSIFNTLFGSNGLIAQLHQSAVTPQEARQLREVNEYVAHSNLHNTPTREEALAFLDIIAQCVPNTVKACQIIWENAQQALRVSHLQLQLQLRPKY